MQRAEESTNVVEGGICHSGAVQLNQNSIHEFHYHEPSTAAEPRSNPWTVPRPVNRLFIGRGDISEKLASAFHHGGKVASTTQSRFVIAGLGGTGKSEVCLKFASDHKDDYWGIFWIDCSSESNAQDGFRRIGKICKLCEPDIPTVKDYLSTVTEKWLLIIDNADNPEVDYSGYFPTRDKGDIIITTRNPEFMNRYSTVGSEDLDQLDFELARVLLFRATEIPETEWPKKEDQATQIVNQLGRHTLAILQAGAFIRESCSLEEYLGLYRTQRDRLFKYSANQEQSTHKTVHATFEVSVERLQALVQGGSTAAKDALSLLDILAFMHYEGAPELIFSEAASYASDILADKAEKSHGGSFELSRENAQIIPGYLPHATVNATPRLRWQQVCSTLGRFSLAKILESDGLLTIVIHPLVHAWLKERQEISTLSASWLTASTILALSCKGNRSYIPTFEMLQSHMRACLGDSIEVYSDHVGNKKLAPVLIQLSRAKLHLYDFHNAGALYAVIEKELARSTAGSYRSNIPKTLGSTIIDVVRNVWHGPQKTYEIEINKAELYFIRGFWALKTGNLEAGLGNLQQAVKIQKQRLNPEHPDLLETQYYLAVAYLTDWNFVKAIRLLENAIEAEKDALDVNSFGISLLRSGLATAYEFTEKTEKAVQLAEHNVEMVKRKYPEGHNHLVSVQHQLALAYDVNGQFAEAIQLGEHVYRTRSKFNEGHPERLATEHNLARAYLSNGQVEEGIVLLEHVVKVRGNLGKTHFLHLNSQRSLVKAYKNNGQNEKAKEIEKRFPTLWIDRGEDSHDITNFRIPSSQVIR